MSESPSRTLGIGMLWQDSGPEPLADRVRRAAAFYEVKYGQKAVRCRVNPVDLHAPGQYIEKVDDIVIVADARIVKGHLWLAGRKK